MEYTKDLILNVQYREVPKRFCMPSKNRTSTIINHIKKHKIIVASMAIGGVLMIIDGILIMNFIQLFERL